MTIQEGLEKAVQLLKKENISDSVLISRILLAYTINKSKEYLIIHNDEEIEAKSAQKYFAYIEQAIQGQPVQYITHHQEFMKLDFFVNENVLIPQPDTENLVEEVLNLCRGNKVYEILDLCTGSGAIGISLAKYINNSKVTLSDISKKALEVANKNVEKLNLKEKINIENSDLFKNIQGKFDIIVSNPPYIETDVIHTLSKNVQNEPVIALDGGKDGLKFYRQIAQNAYKFLNRAGYLCLEIGYQQKNSVIEILEQTNKYKDIYYKKDLSGNNRVVIAKVR